MTAKNAIPRREFLGQASAATVAAALAGSAGGADAAAAVSHGLAHRHFEDLVGDDFLARGQTEDAVPYSANLKLVEATPCSLTAGDGRPAHVRQEPFSLLFTAPKGTQLANATHHVNHPHLGNVDLFLQQTRWDRFSHADVYEAVIN